MLKTKFKQFLSFATACSRKAADAEKINGLHTASLSFQNGMADHG